MNARYHEGELVALILAGHFHLIELMQTALAGCLEHPEQLEIASLRFPLLAQLLAAHGRITADELADLEAVNWLRNRLAHEIEDRYKLASVTVETVRKCRTIASPIAWKLAREGDVTGCARTIMQGAVALFESTPWAASADTRPMASRSRPKRSLPCASECA